MLYENADEHQRAKIESALEPPATYRHNGAPAWWSSDEDTWAEWQKQM